MWKSLPAIVYAKEAVSCICFCAGAEMMLVRTQAYFKPMTIPSVVTPR